MDLYHAQIVEGDLTEKLRQYMPHIGHIQIANVPGRTEPDSGEINYGFLFKVIDELRYDGWIGCEYRPLKGNRRQAAVALPVAGSQALGAEGLGVRAMALTFTWLTADSRNGAAVGSRRHGAGGCRGISQRRQQPAGHGRRAVAAVVRRDAARGRGRRPLRTCSCPCSRRISRPRRSRACTSCCSSCRSPCWAFAARARARRICFAPRRRSVSARDIGAFRSQRRPPARPQPIRVRRRVGLPR